MEFAILSLIAVNSIIINAEPCELQRDKYNEYPWMVKIFWRETRGHGSLVAPNRILSAYQPFKHLITTSSLIPRYGFIAGLQDAGGNVRCKERMRATIIADNYDKYHNLMFWNLAGSFEVSVGSPPYLIPRPKDMTVAKVEERVRNLGKDESCSLPLFKERLTQSTDLQVVKLKEVNESILPEWWDIFCQNMPCPKRHRFNGYSFQGKFERHSTSDSWLQGAILFCRGGAVGLLDAVGNGTAEGFFVFEELVYALPYLRFYAYKHWPHPDPTPSTSDTEPQGSTEIPATLTATVTATPTTASPSTKNDDLNTSSTYIIETSWIPKAPVWVGHQTTAISEPFSNTRRKWAKYINHNCRPQICECLMSAALWVILFPL